MIPSLFRIILETDRQVRPPAEAASRAAWFWASLQSLGPRPHFPAFGVPQGALDVHLDQTGLRGDGVKASASVVPQPIRGCLPSRGHTGRGAGRVCSEPGPCRPEPGGSGRRRSPSGPGTGARCPPGTSPPVPGGARTELGSACSCTCSVLLPVHLHVHATLVSGSRRLTLFSSTCSTSSWVHTFPLASRRRRRLTPSSTLTIPSLRSNTKVVRCYGGSEQTGFPRCHQQQAFSAVAHANANTAFIL